MTGGRRRRRQDVRRLRRRGARALGLAVLAVVASSCGLSLQALPKPGGINGPSYQLHAVFANVLNLPIQARVLIGSDQVGQVSAIGTKNFKADLTLTIRGVIRIPKGTTAQILFVDPLGDEFIELHPPSGQAHNNGGAYLSNGATLPQSQTTSAPSIPDTLAALGTLLNGGGLNQLQTIITQLNTAIGGHQQQIRSILADLAYTVTALNDNKGAVDNALSGLAALSTQLAKGDAAIAAGLDTIGPAVAVLNQENGDFSQILTSAQKLSDVATSIVDTSNTSILGTIHQFDGLINQMVGVEAEFGPTLADLSRFEANTKKVAPGNYLQLSLNGTAIVNQTPLLAPNAPAANPNQAAADQATAQAIRALLGAGLP
jgi:phospholipid/cholesterol/gamma-HCH transport system substrate-binding protein